MTLREVDLPTIPIVNFDDVRLSDERDYIVKGIVPKNGIVVWWGPPKSGKSFLAFDLCMHVALGWEYRGRRVVQGPVLYIAAEGGGGLAKRVEAFRQEKMAEGAAETPLKLITVRLELVHQKDELINSIAMQMDEPPVLVIVDTLNRTFTGSESSDTDMTAYIGALDMIRNAFNCTAVVVHHCGLDETRYRGHTSLLGALDAEIAVQKDKQNQTIAEVRAMRDTEDGTQWASAIRQVVVGEDVDGDEITSCVVDPVDDYEPAKRQTSKKPPAQQQNALKMLQKAIDESGKVPPASNHIPPNTQAVSVALWRRYCDLGIVTTSDKADTRSKAFKRASEGLQERGLIGVWDEWVWVA